jgi:heptose III glucuronosyltransferase
MKRDLNSLHPNQYCFARDVTLSVIVPVFNAANFIARCLDSLMTAHDISMEIVVVDDGSTDATASILHAYQAQHDNIRVITQTNRGVSVARNVGLAAAVGEFVAFVDADDQVDAAWYRSLVARAQQDELDMVMANAWIYGLDGSEGRLFPQDMSPVMKRGAIWLAEARAARLLRHYIWCHVYRRDFLQRHSLRFEPGISHSDIIWTNQVLLNAERVAFDGGFLYHYHQRAGSLSLPLRQSGNDARQIETARHYVRVASLLETLAVSFQHDAQAAHALRLQLIDAGIAVFQIARKLERSYRRTLFAHLRAIGFLSLLERNTRQPAERWRVWKRSLRFRLSSARTWVRVLMQGTAY